MTDFSDREFLALCIDALDGDGWFSAQTLIEGKELAGLKRHHVSNRCSWLWRYGILEREHLADEHGSYRYVSGDPDRPKWGQRWRLTQFGEAYLDGTLTKRQSEQLEGMGERAPLEVTRQLSQMLKQAPDVARNLMLREWRYQTHDVRAVVLEVERRR